jgi:HK97 family phage major capsid protein
MAETITKELLDEVRASRSETKALKDQLDKLSRTPAKMTNAPAHVFGFEKDWQSDPRSWPWDKMPGLDGAYASNVALELMSGSRQKRLTGLGDRRFGSGKGTFGQALVKMAGLAAQGSDNKAALQIASSQGMPSDYNYDKFEEEFGITTITKAAKTGVKGFNGEVRKTALAESSGQTGGYVIPPQFMTELLTIAAEEGFIQQLCKVIPMTTREVDWPMLDITTAQSAGTTPYFGGVFFQWQPEAQSISETEPTFRQSKWTAWDLVGYTVSSNQLLQDNGVGVDALLTQLFGAAVTWYSEYAFLNGLGAGNSMPLGILNAGATIQQSRSTPGHFTLRDAAAMLSHLQIRSWDTCCWIVHQSVIPDLIQMVDNTSHNQLVWLSPYGDAAKNMGPISMKLPQAFLNGRPLYITEKLPSIGSTGDVLLADFSRYVVGNRMDMQIDVSPHYKFQNNQLTWRVVARKDGKPWLNGPITDAQGWSLSPFIALKA